MTGSGRTAPPPFSTGRCLNDTGSDDWAFMVSPEAERIGRDVITVGLFYRRALALESIVRPQVLDGPEFRRLSRQPLAQQFRERLIREKHSWWW